MYQIIDGKELARSIRGEVKKEVDNLREKNVIPKLAVIMVGDNSASKVYVKNKSKACQECGVEFEEILLDANTSMETLLSIIDKLNERTDINGILLQSPIPKDLNIQEAFERISYKKDVDGFNPVNVGKLMIGEDTFISCTPYGINTHRLILTGKRVPYSEKKKDAIEPEMMSWRELLFTALPFVIVFILLVKYVLKKRKERKLKSWRFWKKLV